MKWSQPAPSWIVCGVFWAEARPVAVQISRRIITRKNTLQKRIIE
jgi:hypothetical protein